MTKRERGRRQRVGVFDEIGVDVLKPVFIPEDKGVHDLKGNIWQHMPIDNMFCIQKQKSCQ